MAIGQRNQRQIIHMIGDLRRFKIGNVSAEWYPHGGAAPVGWLNEDLTRALRTVPGPVYVIYSYGTPIAWRAAGGQWQAPRRWYSVTTTGHVAVVAQGMRAWDDKIDKVAHEVR